MKLLSWHGVPPYFQKISQLTGYIWSSVNSPTATLIYKVVIPNSSYYEQQFLCRPLTQAGEQRGREENSANSNIIRQLLFGRKARAI